MTWFQSAWVVKRIFESPNYALNDRQVDAIVDDVGDRVGRFFQLYMGCATYNETR